MTQRLHSLLRQQHAAPTTLADDDEAGAAARHEWRCAANHPPRLADPRRANVQRFGEKKLFLQIFSQNIVTNNNKKRSQSHS